MNMSGKEEDTSADTDPNDGAVSARPVVASVMQVIHESEGSDD